jgi:hypothetical protein
MKQLSETWDWSMSTDHKAALPASALQQAHLRMLWTKQMMPTLLHVSDICQNLFDRKVTLITVACSLYMQIKIVTKNQAQGTTSGKDCIRRWHFW